MAIDELMELIPAFKGEVDADVRKRTEKALGTALPEDYWDYVITYGAGSFLDYDADEEEDELFDEEFGLDDEDEAEDNGFVGKKRSDDDDEDDDDEDDDDDLDDDDDEDAEEGAYEIPFDMVATDKTFPEWSKKIAKQLEAERQHWETEYQIHPARPGLLPFAKDDDGGILAWLTEGDPEEWPIMAKARTGEWERFDMPLTMFLTQIFLGKVFPNIWNSEGHKRWNLDKLRFAPRD